MWSDEILNIPAIESTHFKLCEYEMSPPQGQIYIRQLAPTFKSTTTKTTVVAVAAAAYCRCHHTVM
jgi:hypothetical protein